MSSTGSVTAGTAASFTRGIDSFTTNTPTVITFTIDSANQNLTIGTTAGTTASFTQGVDTFTANTPTSVTLPTSSAITVVTSVSSS